MFFQNCHIHRTVELRRAVALSRAQRADHRVVVNGTKTHHMMKLNVRDKHLPRRGHHSDTTGIFQRAGRSRQRTHPGAVSGPQHGHTIVVLIHCEEEGIVGGQG